MADISEKHVVCELAVRGTKPNSDTSKIVPQVSAAVVDNELSPSLDAIIFNNEEGGLEGEEKLRVCCKLLWPS